ELCEIGGDSDTLALPFSPGPLTIVVSALADFPIQVIGRDRMIGLRVPRRGDTVDLISKSGGSLIGTSANISGTPSLRQAKDALTLFDGKVDVVLNGGSLTTLVEPTVVTATRGGTKGIRSGTSKRRNRRKAREPQCQLQVR